jgi:uncharacterized protein YbbC (DUF1343 family)/CubicO group peptidase (beta-lactamase class C family)
VKPRTLHLSTVLLPLVLEFACAVPANASRLLEAAPSQVGLDAAKLEQIDGVVREGIEQGRLPGAVVLVVRQGKVAFRKAYGLRGKDPGESRMTIDTVFDLASLTKPVATATSVMILLERGKLALSDPVSRHLPEFGRNGKDHITVEQMLLHTSGLLADNPVEDYQDGRKKALERIWQLRPDAETGKRFLYSDVNFIVLGELVERLTGEPLDAFARKGIFQPLGMRETAFRPNEELSRRAAPTQWRSGRWMRGEVHDPRAYLLGGVAGHAGLFSTADDLGLFAAMVLKHGSLDDKRILNADTVKLMTRPVRVSGGLRALGWDVDTRFSSNRGDSFPLGSFGHTGFTGTSLWLDPTSQTAVIFLSNRVHPDGKGQINRLRGQVASLVAASIIAPPFPAPFELPSPGPDARDLAPVFNGIDVLERDGFKALKGKRVGLVTNHTGVDREGTSTIDLLHRAQGVSLVALFSPEHGIRGEVDRLVPDSKDEKTGLPVFSLYGARKRPAPEQLRGIDTLVYDIQDIGCRFYTYLTTLGYVLETAAENKLKVVVLDRPNPIGGLAVEGPVLDRKLESFTGYHPLPVRHGMTLGELAQLFNRERKINADLQVIAMEGWRRADLFDRTNLVWINPSPNMRTLAAALLYPGIGLLETTNLSVGRGTDRPFEILGAPWLDGRRLSESLARAHLSGVRFVPTRFTPKSSTHAGTQCGGIQIFLDDWRVFQSLPVGITIATHLRQLYPTQWEVNRYGQLLAHLPTLEALTRGDTAEQIMKLWQQDLASFRAVRARYLLYPNNPDGRDGKNLAPSR